MNFERVFPPIIKFRFPKGFHSEFRFLKGFILSIRNFKWGMGGPTPELLPLDPPQPTAQCGHRLSLLCAFRPISYLKLFAVVLQLQKVLALGMHSQ